MSFSMPYVKPIEGPTLYDRRTPTAPLAAGCARVCRAGLQGLLELAQWEVEALAGLWVMYWRVWRRRLPVR